ncbi:VOC family protein [Amnibacterium flavum]|uniref:Glyoxalase n=1 Tax=Amnibacterium flavum TaxID=2173173 RepID=A0A2V1HPW8_9MICO|nr:VOC family protein [Amnibacterium flavum]PVZ94575.1 glyoxalase [Amnibacterium flavum]
MTNPPRTYLQGVPSWIDTEQPDPDQAAEFYAALFGWEFHQVTPAAAPVVYLVATLDGEDVAGLGGVPDGATETAWNTYIAVDDADLSARRVEAAGGSIVVAAEDAGPGGRSATVADPAGARFRLWQARRRLGAQIVNAPGSWNFSTLHTPDPDAALAFYGEVFGWEALGRDPGLGDVMVAVPGYGDHLEATVDPDIRDRQAFAPDRFEDVVAWVGSTSTGETAGWKVQFTVADRDAVRTAAVAFGGTVVSTRDTDWTLEALIEDPQGARFVASQFLGG